MGKFLPVTPEELKEDGFGVPDFVYVCGDAYVDHPSFGAAIITRVLEDRGFKCAMLCQPDWRNTDDFKKFGRPRLGFLVSSGNIDSMVAHYTAAKKKRNNDYYSPGGKAGYRPDRAVIVYCNRIREAYGDVPILIGGLEASLRRFAHYDYWTDKVRRSVLVDSRADILMYGMGELSVVRLAELLDKGVPVKKIRDVRGTAYLCRRGDKLNFEPAQGYDENAEPVGYDYDVLKSDKAAYAKAFMIQYENNDHISGKAVVEYYGDKMLVQNPPQRPLEREELDRVYDLPFARDYHPMYEKDGGVPAIKEVKFSITHNRGCFGGCNFCAIAFHQGRSVRSRSIESVVKEAEKIAAMPDFKGYIHDVGGPTANFRHPSCKEQLKRGMCRGRRCLVPKPCPKLDTDESEYIELLERVEAVPGVKKVFIRSGIRFDYMMYDHVSGQLKVAPEHCSDNVLRAMGKPEIDVFNKFSEKFYSLCELFGLEQYLVPYLMSSHPGATMDDALSLAVYTKRAGISPEQVQDFYPTPGTASTVMYYTGIDPFTGKKIYTPSEYREKQIHRALLQWRRPSNRRFIEEARGYCTEKGIEYIKELGIREPKRSAGDKAADRKGGGKRRGEEKSRGEKSRGVKDRGVKNKRADGQRAGTHTAGKNGFRSGKANPGSGSGQSRKTGARGKKNR